MTRCYDIARFLTLLHPTGVYEIRSLKVPEWKGGKKLSTAAGWFCDHSAAVKAIQSIEDLEPKAVYCTLNACDPTLLGRSNNRARFGGTTTADENIVRRTALLIDVDPQRLADTNSTDKQMTAAIELAGKIQSVLTGDGWPGGLFAMTGNGACLYYRIDLPNDNAATELIQRLLVALSDAFSTDICHVDTGMFNAARICKVAGTMTRKGEHVIGVAGLDDMPQRQSWFIDIDGPLETVPTELLKAWADKAPIDDSKQQRSKPNGVVRDPNWLESWIDRFNVPVGRPITIGNGKKYFFEELPPPCKNSPSGHDCDGGQFIIEYSDGKYGAGCHHSRCRHWGWRDLRLSYEPDAYDWEETKRHVESPEFQASLESIRTQDERKQADNGVGNDSHSEPEQPQQRPEPQAQPQPEATAQPKQDRPPTKRAGAILTAYMAKLRRGDVAQLYPQYSSLEGFEIGPGLLTPIVGPPGGGKTALAMQLVADAMALDESLRVVIANAEMDPETLLQRQLTRKTRIDSDAIRFGRLTDLEFERLTTAVDDLSIQFERLSFLDEPVVLTQLMRLKDETPGFLVVDYLQLFAPADKEARLGVNEVVKNLRGLAKSGWGVLALSAAKRSPNGYTAKEMGLTSFKESGEIEFNADSAYVLCDNGPIDPAKPYVTHVTLKHVKNRHGRCKDFELQFHKPRMEFSAMPQAETESAYVDDFKAFNGTKPAKVNPFGGRK